jgi:hypothetical protein
LVAVLANKTLLSHTSHQVIVVLLSILVQLPLAAFLGHYFDQRLFLQTGYLVSSGLSPYQPYHITVFQGNLHLIGVNSVIGYPPLWPLLLGFFYRLTYDIVPDLFFYNFVSKIPIIISNVALAYTTKNIMQQHNLPPQKIKFAWLFLLFNPFILLTTTAWGEFDTTIALLSVAGLYLLSKGMVGKSALLLSLGFVLKPISLPLLGLPLLFCLPKNRERKLIYSLIVAGVVLSLGFAIFFVLNWPPPLTADKVTSFFRMSGGMTLFSIVELFQASATLPIGFEVLGYLWIPALAIGYVIISRRPPKSLAELMQAAVALLLIFFLSRSWLSEPNVNLLIPLMLILLGFEKISSRSLNCTWIITFIFMILNLGFFQLFFLIEPSIMNWMWTWSSQIDIFRLLLRFSVAVLWTVFASKLLIDIQRRV